jgi:putative transposase
MLRSHAGAARFAWNWALARCQERYAAEHKWYSGPELHKLWNAAKKADPALSWWDQNSKCAYQEAFRDLDRALRDFIKSKTGERKGRRLGFPRFKKRGKCRDAFRLTGALRCAGATVTLPRLGAVRTHESTRKLARRLDNGTARILSATICRTAHRWQVSFTAEVRRAIPVRHDRPGSAIGVDLGITTLLTGADNLGNVVIVDGPKSAARLAAQVAPRIPRALAQAARLGQPPQARRPAGPHPRPRGERPR